ncbi:Sec20 family protein [Perilla frutescens var. frutescens]|nr:Sec20 family protein [Perilla frutescens var. frutescens]
MDKVAEEVEKVKKEFQGTYEQTLKHMDSIKEYGKTSRISNQSAIEEAEKKDSLPRLNGLAQDGLNMLQSLQFNLDLLAPQLPSADDVEKAQSLRELLLGGGEESTARRRNLQTKAGMTSAAESITESLRRTRQLMVQVVHT